MTLIFLENIKGNGDKQQMQDDIDKWPSGLKNGKCYSILRNVKAYTHGRETLGWTMKWEELFYKC